VAVAQRHLRHWVPSAGREGIVDQGGGDIGRHQPAGGGVGWGGVGWGGVGWDGVGWGAERNAGGVG
jgi:hypothetical protein